MSGLNRSERVNVRFAPAEADELRKVAKIEGKKLHEFVRQVVISAARRRLTKIENRSRQGQAL